MKRLFLLLTAGCFLYPVTNYGSETAHARLFCYSLRFQQGSGPYGAYLNLSSTGGTPYNGELFPYSGREWASDFFLYYGGYSTIPGYIYVNLPPVADANSNGFDDFFETSQGVSATTSGSEETSLSSGTVTATWSRAAGSANGTCQLHIVDDTYSDLGTYNCPFTLIEYTGPLTYMPGSNTVSAAINLTQTGNPANTLAGPIIFDKSSISPFNTLTNRAGVWTNATMQQLAFYDDLILRDTTEQTNYFSYYVFEFTDGDPSTTASDYLYWGLSIDDTNDANSNGIPDFSDNPGVVAPPHAPHLTLLLGSTNLLLKISGDVGHSNQVQEIGSLVSTNWQTRLSFRQTNDPQVVSLPLPANTPKFWRVVAW